MIQKHDCGSGLALGKAWEHMLRATIIRAVQSVQVILFFKGLPRIITGRPADSLEFVGFQGRKV